MQTNSFNMVAALAAALAFSGCAASTGTAPGGGIGASNVGQRDLTPEEKKVIIDAVAPALREPASARYHWAKFPILESATNYCATVDAKSPYAAYNGRQAYVVEVKLAGGRITSATMGLIAGGKDVAVVAKLCARYGLDPNKAS